jgi:hypothetical protein
MTGNTAKPNGGTAMFTALSDCNLKARTLTLAASPLFNGTATEPPSFSLVDNRGIELFPQTYDANKKRLADRGRSGLGISGANIK